MDIQAEKLILIEQLAKVQDVGIINQVKKILERRNNSVIGYSNGSPINRKQFIERIEAAEKRIENGESISHEDVVKDAANW
jgi:hypothetical protein